MVITIYSNLPETLIHRWPCPLLCLPQPNLSLFQQLCTRKQEGIIKYPILSPN